MLHLLQQRTDISVVREILTKEALHNNAPIFAGYLVESLQGMWIARQNVIQT